MRLNGVRTLEVPKRLQSNGDEEDAPKINDRLNDQSQDDEPEEAELEGD